MTRPSPVFCKDCKYSFPEENSSWNLKCKHPKVNAIDPYALASTESIPGTSCREERAVKYTPWAACGQVGKLWESKE